MFTNASTIKLTLRDKPTTMNAKQLADLEEWKAEADRGIREYSYLPIGSGAHIPTDLSAKKIAELEEWKNKADTSLEPYIYSAITSKIDNVLALAVAFATHKHAGVFRKNSKALPYVTHPISVAKRLRAAGVTSVDVLEAAYLHDTIEDTDTTYGEIVAMFSKETADFVREVTDDRSLSKVDRKRAQVEKAKTMSNGARLIKLADKLDNLTDLEEDQPVDWTVEDCQGYFIWAMTVVAQMRGTNAELERQLDAFTVSSFVYKKTGEVHRCIPNKALEDMDAAVEAYYASLA
jgi:hypothetical protein